MIIDFTDKISSLYTPNLVKLSLNLFDNPGPTKNETLLLQTVCQIKQLLNINLKYFTITTDFKLLIPLNSYTYNITPTEDNCLLALKKTLNNNADKIILNLTTLPLYYELNLQNIRPLALILPVSDYLQLVLSDHFKLKPPLADPFITAAVRTYLNLLQNRKTLDQINYGMQIIELFKNYLPHCDKNMPYYRIMLQFNRKITQKLHSALYIDGILTTVKDNKLIFLLKPLVEQKVKWLISRLSYWKQKLKI